MNQSSLNKSAQPVHQMSSDSEEIFDDMVESSEESVAPVIPNYDNIDIKSGEDPSEIEGESLRKKPRSEFGGMSSEKTVKFANQLEEMGEEFESDSSLDKKLDWQQIFLQEKMMGEP